MPPNTNSFDVLIPDSDIDPKLLINKDDPMFPYDPNAIRRGSGPDLRWNAILWPESAESYKDIAENSESESAAEREPAGEQLEALHTFVSRHLSAAHHRLSKASDGEPEKIAFTNERLLYEIASKISQKESFRELEEEALAIAISIVYDELYYDSIDASGEFNHVNEIKLAEASNLAKEILADPDKIRENVKKQFDEADMIDPVVFDQLYGNLYKSNGDKEWWQELPSYADLEDIIEGLAKNLGEDTNESVKSILENMQNIQNYGPELLLALGSFIVQNENSTATGELVVLLNQLIAIKNGDGDISKLEEVENKIVELAKKEGIIDSNGQVVIRFGKPKIVSKDSKDSEGKEDNGKPSDAVSTIAESHSQEEYLSIEEEREQTKRWLDKLAEEIVKTQSFTMIPFLELKNRFWSGRRNEYLLEYESGELPILPYFINENALKEFVNEIEDADRLARQKEEYYKKYDDYVREHDGSPPSSNEMQEMMSEASLYLDFSAIAYYKKNQVFAGIVSYANNGESVYNSEENVSLMVSYIDGNNERQILVIDLKNQEIAKALLNANETVGSLGENDGMPLEYFVNTLINKDRKKEGVNGIEPIKRPNYAHRNTWKDIRMSMRLTNAP